jgi:hypothetical protein
MLTRKRDKVPPIAAFWIGKLTVVHTEDDFSLQFLIFTANPTLVGMELARCYRAVERNGSNLTKPFDCLRL